MDKQAIFQAGKPKTSVVEIPEWGNGDGPLRLTIREFSAGDAIELGKQEEDERGTRQIIASVIHPETEQLMFTETDIPELRRLSVAGTIRLNRAINQLNGFGESERKN